MENSPGPSSRLAPVPQQLASVPAEQDGTCQLWGNVSMRVRVGPRVIDHHPLQPYPYPCLPQPGNISQSVLWNILVIFIIIISPTWNPAL